MLSDAEKRDLQDMANDPKLREDCEMLRRSAREFGRQCPLDVYVSFLDCLHQIQSVPPLPKPFPLYSDVRL